MQTLPATTAITGHPSSSKHITALRELRGSRVEIALDGMPWRVVPAEAAVRAGLRVGQPLDRGAARALVRAMRHESAMRRATRALAARDLARADLDARLVRAGVREAARNDALDSLERAGLVDDGRVAEGRARALVERGYGDAAIRADLARRGVEDALAAEAVEALEPERERLKRLLERRGLDARSAGWLMRRGFGEDAIEEALEFGHGGV